MSKKKLFPNGFKNSRLFTFGKALVLNATGIGAAKTGIKGAIGAVNGVVGSIKDLSVKNKESEVGGKGKTDISEWLGVTIGVVILLVTVYLLITGQITLDQFIEANTAP